MNNNTKSPTNPHKKINIIVCSVLALFVIIGGGGWFLYSRLVPPTYPLGERLEYVGEEKYGCYLICDANPASTYYYATDMSVEEVVMYFKGAVLKNDSDYELTTDPKTSPITFSLGTNKNEKSIEFYIDYYIDGSEETKNLALKRTSKNHLIIINSGDYQTAKDAL
jgi:hypothetical protein